MGSKASDVLRRALGATIWIGLLAAAPAFAVPAATVEFASGNPVAVAAGGQSRPLTKGSGLESGEAVNTNDGRAQLRFSDGAYVSLQPQTVFRIDGYRYDNKTDGSEQGFFSLLKGGLRTITGLVGRTNKKNYRVTTAVATIGIRGTEYTLSLGDSLTGSVGEGEVEVCSGAGCVPFASGQSFIVTNPTSTPQLTARKTDLPPNQPQGPLPSFVSGDVVSQNGDPIQFLLTGQHSLTVAYNYCCQPTPGTGAFVELNASGGVMKMDIDVCGDGCIQTVTFDSLKEFGNVGSVAWGIGIVSSNPNALVSPSNILYVPYVVGLPMTDADLKNLAVSVPVGVYTMVGATTVLGRVTEGEVSSSQVTGKVDKSTLTLNFAGQPTASWTADLSIAGATLKMAASGMTVSSNSSGTTFADHFQACSVNGVSGSCSVAGAVFTPKGSAAGVVYSGNTSSGSSSLNVQGAIAYTLTPK